MHLTVDMLREAGACEEGVQEFRAAFPRGIVVTTCAVRKAVLRGLDVHWAVQCGLVPARLAEQAGLRPKSPEDAIVWGRQLGPSDATRAAACMDPWAALVYARSVDRCPRSTSRA